jgi:hypothetical protein
VLVLTACVCAVVVCRVRRCAGQVVVESARDDAEEAELAAFMAADLL